VIRSRHTRPRLLALAAALGVVIVSASSGFDAAADARDGGVSPITGRERDAGAPRDAASDAADAGVDAGMIISRTPPDPPAMSERKQWVFDLRWDRGEIYLLEVHQVDMGGPHVTPRVMGRFALELFEGPTLIERVRFDFPMLGVPEAPDAGFLRTPPRLEPKLRTRIGVLMPATKRGTKLELWDRARDVRVALPWPPTEGPVGADAGAP
jgi:hypothetical protein